MSNSNATTGQVSQPTTTLATPQGNATQVSARLFLDDILPPLDSGADVDALIQRNPPVPRKFGKLITTGGRLWGFPKNPSKSRRLEKAAYKNLDHVAASIAQEGSKQGFKRVVEFTTNATGDARIGRRQAGSFPDAYFLVRKDSSDGVVGWPEVAVCGEYRKNASPNDEREVSVAFGPVIRELALKDGWPT
ncbi:hypothetical protein PHLCEN_2v3162 [Hermanssonia centrifuga]|uniref:Uncharacterized protein n=1 Tax=Hermanssonia centrifuga TaxID=98765 RepID=A0A2R6R132_9APHY|nr:hypothetical protein PHLCEN_2v3162 [Hermanssonia centrifuga]